MVIILVGVSVAALGFKPLPAILFAQATNALLLPVIAIFLLVVMNKSQALGCLLITSRYQETGLAHSLQGWFAV